MNKSMSKLSCSSKLRIKAQGKPGYCLRGIRRRNGVNLIRAFVWNVGTCDFDVKGKAYNGKPPVGRKYRSKIQGHIDS